MEQPCNLLAVSLRGQLCSHVRQLGRGQLASCMLGLISSAGAETRARERRHREVATSRGWIDAGLRRGGGGGWGGEGCEEDGEDLEWKDADDMEGRCVSMSFAIRSALEVRDHRCPCQFVRDEVFASPLAISP
eukprot:9472817-Pyramimonas_sp.AAC.2